MALVLKGRIVPMAADRSVAPDDTAAFAGAVWIDDTGTVAAVTRGRAAGPAHLAGARVVDVGSRLVVPGFVDLHNHLAYNTLPLWAEPSRTRPWAHHDAWPGAPTYAAKVTWPAYAFITAAPEALLAYVETKAIVGGTTSIQGSPPKNRPRDGWLVRNIEDERFGTKEDLVLASTLTLDSTALADRARRMVPPTNRGFIYHCAEGAPGSIVAREFTAARAAGCLLPTFVGVHLTALTATDWASWTTPGALAWSPLSNLWLYGVTTDVLAARRAGVKVCLGSDWAPSGSRSVLGELKVARLVSDRSGWGLTDADLVRMVTANPGDALATPWRRQAGRLQPGALGDVVVLAAKRRADPFRTIVDAAEKDVELVVVDGVPRYGTPELMASAGAVHTSALDVGGLARTLSLTVEDDPATAWAFDDVLARLEEVRADPKGQIERARARLAGWAGPLDDPGAPLRLALDMPTGLGPVGGLPKDLTTIVVPPLEGLRQDGAWVAGLSGRAFHGGLLDGLSRWYS